MKAYAADVREGRFPTDEHCYHMVKGEAEKLPRLLKDFE